MAFLSLSIEHLRIIEGASLPLDAPFVYLGGENGAGKTTVLEALHMVATGHSFRAQQSRQLITHDQPLCRVMARWRDENGDVDQIGLERQRSGALTIRRNQQALTRLSDLAIRIPIRSITPESHQLITGGTAGRRRYLDWGVFHVEQSPFPWRDYNRALAQRNEMLKSGGHAWQLDALDNLLAQTGEVIAALRADYLDHLQNRFQAFLTAFAVDLPIQLRADQGWSSEISLAQSLADRRQHCQRMKTTTVGPHRGDLVITANGKPARDVLSRGQQKLVLYALTLAQIADYRDRRARSLVLLCDDLASELDAGRRDRLLSQVLEQGHQVFVSGTARDPDFSVGEPLSFQMTAGALAAR